MSKMNWNKYLTSTVMILVFVLTIMIIFSGCRNSKLIKKKKQFERMSDKELLSYYYQINNRLDDIDRNTEQNKVIDNNNYDPNRDRITHLHIGDTWGHLQKEKKLVLSELHKRNITP